MTTLPLVENSRGYASKILRDLRAYGWQITHITRDGLTPRNGLKLILNADWQELRLRIFAYKVTTSGRSRSHERRIEITTTYQSGLKHLRGFRDVVLGVDSSSGNYVGINPKRLNMGGTTHNASSFFDLEGLSVKKNQLLVNPRDTSSTLFPNGIEHHAFFGPPRLSEYLFNQQEIHVGNYAFQGPFSGKSNARRISGSRSHLAKGDAFALSRSSKGLGAGRPLSARLIASVQDDDFTKIRGRKLSPAELKRLLNICDEIGALGEQFVLAEERKRLRKLGHLQQERKVERVSLWSVSEGYDILSFENDGDTRRYLEVKSTTGSGTVVDISASEWSAAKIYKERYYIVRVTNVRKSPRMYFINNPSDLDRRGTIEKTATGWRIDLKAALKAGN